MPKKGFKWSEEQRLQRSAQYSGINNPFYGKKHTSEARDKMGKFKKGVFNGYGFSKGNIPWNKHIKGIHLSPSSEFKKGMRLPYESYRRAENHPHWKGGVSSRYRETYLKNIAGRERPELCEVCGKSGRIYFDHDHNTGKFRGWICSNCNFILGHAYDNPKILILLSKYLKKHGK